MPNLGQATALQSTNLIYRRFLHLCSYTGKTTFSALYSSYHDYSSTLQLDSCEARLCAHLVHTMRCPLGSIPIQKCQQFVTKLALRLKDAIYYNSLARHWFNNFIATMRAHLHTRRHSLGPTQVLINAFLQPLHLRKIHKLQDDLQTVLFMCYSQQISNLFKCITPLSQRAPIAVLFMDIPLHSPSPFAIPHQDTAILSRFLHF